MEDCNTRGKKSASRRSSLVASVPKTLLQNTVAPIASLKQLKITKESSSQLIFFLLKIAALDLVRRVSKRRFPLLWKSIQGISLLKYAPFGWLQKWTPFRRLAKCTEGLSKPVMCVSIASAFLDSKEEECSTRTQADCLTTADSIVTEQTELPESDLRVSQHSEVEGNVKLRRILRLLKEELGKDGITLPDRVNDDELERFYLAASGDFSLLMSSVKKTIRWRETYYFLTPQELDCWSNLVFWHDIQLRPCLVIRLGLACSYLQPDERPRFAQAIVSQIEYGLLHLLKSEDPRVTVLLDCEGISTFKFPVQMMKSCCVLVQEHYPNRLASLYVVHLSPLVRVIAQAIIQILKPVTLGKLHILGHNYLRILAEYLESVPSFLGGDCTCSCCRMICSDDEEDIDRNSESSLRKYNGDNDQGISYENELFEEGGSCQKLSLVVIAFLMLWICIAAGVAGFYDPEQGIPT